MGEKNITKPEFVNVFAVRFLIWLVVFSIAAGSALSQIYHKVLTQVIREPTFSYQHKIVEITEALSKAEPESYEYEKYLNTLSALLAIYQTIGYNYAEVNINDLKLATDKDTVFFYFERDTDEDWIKSLFIEDISYLEPLNEFLKNNGMQDEIQVNDLYYRFGRDPIFDGALPPFCDDIQYYLESFYVNRENFTFIPGVIRINNKGKEYLMDCTPSDTKGYEYMELGNGHGKQIFPAYRIATVLSSKDIVYHEVPGYSLKDDEYNNPGKYGYEIDRSWHVGFSEINVENVFSVAPFSSVLILIGDLFLSAAVAFFLASIKYHKDKTVWEIFEYRIKTTEAMAHDLKTPLSTMMFYLENLEESSEDPVKVREYTKNISDKVVNMDQMISDILLFSRTEAGRADLKIEEVSIKDLVTENLKEYPELKAEIKGDDISVKTDKKVLAQAVANLLSNCDRYGEKGSVIDISIEANTLMISNKTDKIYEDAGSLRKPFVKGDDSRGDKGTGLGLAIADNNLSILGYKLELISEAGAFSAKIKFDPD